jgi:hypothetical protein
MSPNVVVSAFLLDQSENFERKCEDLDFKKFHEPLIVTSESQKVTSAETSEGLAMEDSKIEPNFSSVKSWGR